MKTPEEKYRVKTGPMGSRWSDGCNGYFVIPFSGRTQAHVIISDGMGWEHASVHVTSNKEPRTPTWAEMCKVKELFWGDEETVIQYHPAKSEYVNNFKYCLHLWKPTEAFLPKPPTELVGITDKQLKR